MANFSSLILLALLAAFPAAAAERSFLPIATDDQTVEYGDGDAFLVAQTRNAVVIVSYAPRDKSYGYLRIGFRNTGDQPFNVGESSLSVSANGQPLQVLTYADRVKSFKRRQMWAGIATAVAGATQSYSAGAAGYQTTTGRYSSTTNSTAYGNGGFGSASATTQGNFSATTYDSTAALQARMAVDARNQALRDRQRANAEFQRLELQDRALKMNTVRPGNYVMGDVQFALPKRNKAVAPEFTAVIDVAGEQVTVLFREQR